MKPNNEGLGTSFHPRNHNWRRKNKVPALILNATALNSGHCWQFTSSFMGEPPGRINTEIDANERLRRMYYDNAPTTHKKIRLGHAVAASSCVPGLFEPLVLDNRLADRSDSSGFRPAAVGAWKFRECRSRDTTKQRRAASKHGDCHVGKILDASASVAFKMWKLSRRLRVATAVVAAVPVAVLLWLLLPSVGDTGSGDSTGPHGKDHRGRSRHFDFSRGCSSHRESNDRKTPRRRVDGRGPMA